MKKILLISAILVSKILLSQSTTTIPPIAIINPTIDPNFAGQNAWMPASIDALPSLGGNLADHWDDIKNSGVRYVRIGGSTYDKHFDFASDYSQFINDIISRGMIPIAQLSYKEKIAGVPTPYTDPVQAGNDAVAVVNALYSQGVRNFAIGNEPNLLAASGYHNQNIYGEDQDKAIGIKTYIKEISKQIKDAHPDILVWGPDLNWMQPIVINQLISDPLGNSNSICGKIISAGSGNGKYFIDFLAQHWYPFPYDPAYPDYLTDAAAGRQNVINYLTDPGKFKDMVGDYSAGTAVTDFRGMRKLITDAGRNHLTDLKIAITEANLTTSSPPGDGPEGNGAKSFIGGQFWAEMMCVAMEESVSAMTFWSVREGNGQTDIGYIGQESGFKQPSYYHFKMVAENFKDQFLSNLVPANTNAREHKAFGYKNGTEIGVLIMNQTQGTGSKTFSINFNNSSPASSDIEIQLNGSTTENFECKIPNETTYFLKFDYDPGNGNAWTLIEHLEYGINEAKANKPPKDISKGDIYISDGTGDVGNEPNNETTLWGESDDIWVHNNQDPLDPSAGPYHYQNENTSTNPNNENAEYSTTIPSYIYVRAHNRGCVQITGNIQVRYHDSYIGYSTWNTAWPAIGTGQTITLDPGQEGVIEQMWDYSGVDPSHVPPPGSLPAVTTDFCLIAQFSSTPTEDNDPPGSSSSYLDASHNQNTWGTHYWDLSYTNNARFNNLGQRNIHIKNEGYARRPHWFDFSGVSASEQEYEIGFIDNESGNGNGPFTDHGSVRIDLGKELFEKWVAGGKQGSGVQVAPKCHLSVAGICLHKHLLRNGKTVFDNPYEIEITGPNAHIRNIMMDSSDHFKVITDFDYFPTSGLGSDSVFKYRINGYFYENGQKTFLGNMRYDIKHPGCDSANAGSDQYIGKGCTATLTAAQSDSGAIYNWYDYTSGEFVGTGKTIIVRPVNSTIYELEVKTPEGCIDYDNVSVYIAEEMQSCAVLCSIFDNPTIDTTYNIINRFDQINRNIIVPNGFTLTIFKSSIRFADGAGIEVQPGGKLKIIDSELLSCTPSGPWSGIKITGSGDHIVGLADIEITGTTIKNAVNAVKTELLNQFVFLNNKIDSVVTGLTMSRSSNFTVSGNDFSHLVTGIRTNNSTAGTASVISNNIITNADTAIRFINDNHSNLTISCNTLTNYRYYGIHSNGTTLKNQGSLAHGAGNQFTSNSNKLNHKLRHNGNVMTYYYDPSNPVILTSGGLGLTAISALALANANCTQGNARTTPGQEESLSIGDSKFSDGSKGFRLYPNPNNGTMVFEYQLNQQEKGTLEIYDVTGRKISQYVLQPDKNDLSLNENSLQNGIYFYTVVVNGRVANKGKIVIIK
jgi:hypothetical protein